MYCQPMPFLPSLSSQYVYYPADQLTCLFNLKSIKFSILHNYGKLINLYVIDQIAVLLAIEIHNITTHCLMSDHL